MHLTMGRGHADVKEVMGGSPPAGQPTGARGERLRGVGETERRQPDLQRLELFLVLDPDHLVGGGLGEETRARAPDSARVRSCGR